MRQRPLPLSKRWYAGKRISRRNVLATSGLAGLGAFMLTIVGCGDDAEEQEAPPAAAQEPAPSEEVAGEIDRDLIVAQASLWTSLDQEVASVHENQEAGVNQNAQLMRYNYIPSPDGSYITQDVSGTKDSFQLMLAESWEKSDDGLTYTFKLKKGVISPAGNELTADDVVYTYQRKLALPYIGAFIAAFALEVTDPNQVERVDDYTVRFRLRRPYQTFEHGIANAHAGSIVDSKLLKANATEDDLWAERFAEQNSHGFGAYSVESFTQGQEGIWVANENYVGGAPKIKRMIWRVLPDSSSRLGLVQRGDIHIAKAMLAREQATVTDNNDLFVPNAFTNLSLWLTLNYGFAPFQDLRVRKAFLHTIPYDNIINTVYQGRARRQFGMLWDPIPGTNNSYYQQYVTDIQKARDLMAEAGFADGFDLDCGFEINYPDQEEAATLVRESAAQAGIRLNLVGLTASASNENRSKGDQGLAMFWTRDFAIVQTIPYYLQLFFTPDSILNWAGWHQERGQSAEFWEALQAGINVGDDYSPEALTHFDEAQRLVSEGNPMAWVCWTDPSWIFRSNVAGYKFRTDNLLDYGGLSFTS